MSEALRVERRGVEAVPEGDRLGSPRSQFTLWLGANLTIADYALGFLAVTLGLPWGWAIASIVVGNVLGALALGAAAAMGPTYGRPQMVIARVCFGDLGGRVPAALNYLSTLGWYTVNTILAAFGIELLVPQISFWQAAVILITVQALLGIYGHHLVHLFEQVMSVALAALFLAVSGYLLSRHAELAAYHPRAAGHGVAFAIMVAAALSYAGSWSPYGADYSRYLPRATRRGAVFAWAFAGAFLASVWLELLGVAVAILSGPHSANATAAAGHVFGGFGDLAVVAIVFGGVAANAVNVYSNSLSAAAVGVRVPRWVLALLTSAIGLAGALVSSGRFEANYQDFLLLLGFWFTAWLGVEVVHFYVLRGAADPETASRHTPVSWIAMVSFIAAIAAETPFMNTSMYTGPIAHLLGGADLSFYVGFTVAALSYLGLSAPWRGSPLRGKPVRM